MILAAVSLACLAEPFVFFSDAIMTEKDVESDRVDKDVVVGMKSERLLFPLTCSVRAAVSSLLQAGW